MEDIELISHSKEPKNNLKKRCAACFTLHNQSSFRNGYCRSCSKMALYKAAAAAGIAVFCIVCSLVPVTEPGKQCRSCKQKAKKNRDSSDDSTTQQNGPVCSKCSNRKPVKGELYCSPCKRQSIRDLASHDAGIDIVAVSAAQKQTSMLHAYARELGGLAKRQQKLNTSKRTVDQELTQAQTELAMAKEEVTVSDAYASTLDNFMTRLPFAQQPVDTLQAIQSFRLFPSQPAQLASQCVPQNRDNSDNDAQTDDDHHMQQGTDAELAQRYDQLLNVEA